MGLSLIDLFSKIGISLATPSVTVCCGMPLIHAGDIVNATKIVKNYLDL